MNRPKSAGGLHAILYAMKIARKVGPWRLWRAMRAKNACKTCALGMGGQQGGMRNELGHWPEVCKKSLQAMAADMQGEISSEFFSQYSVEQLKKFSSRDMEALGRISQPLLLPQNSRHFRTVTWQEAFDIITAKLLKTNPRRCFFYFSGRSSNEAGFLLQLFARLYGTNHVNNCSYYCHQASGVGLTGSLGTGTATLTLDDVEHADLVFLIGGNPASNHPRLMTSLMRIRRRGGKVVVVNPLKELGLIKFRIPSNIRSLFFGTDIASHYIQVKIGGDIALLTGIAKYLIEHDQIDQQFIKNHTHGFQEFLAYVRSVSWHEIVSASGVEKFDIENIARLYSQSNNVVFAWTMGITHHQHGVANVQTIVNVALLRGKIGRKYCGVLPIRGHSNVQGLGTMNVTPQLKEAVFMRLQELDIKVPDFKGYDTMACMEASARGEMDIGFCLGGNLYNSNPDLKFAERAFHKLQLVVYLNTTLNPGHVFGTGEQTLILPVLARDEESQPTTQESMFNYVRLSDGGKARVSNAKSEVEVIATIADKVLGQSPVIDWLRLKDHKNIRALIAKMIPGFEKYQTIDQTKQEFYIPGRVTHQPKFSTSTGKAHFAVHKIPNLGELRNNQLRLMSIRSEGQFNTVVYEEQDYYRGQERREVILMNTIDIERMGLSENQKVAVCTAIGEVKNISVRSFDIKAGCAAMYYPEVNCIIPRDIDPLSKTPAFKSVVVTVKAHY